MPPITPYKSPSTSGSTIKYRYVLDGTPPQRRTHTLWETWCAIASICVNGTGQVEDIVSSCGRGYVRR